MDRRSLVLLLALVILASAASLYAPAREFAFVNYDDNDYVYENAAVTGGWTAKAFATAFTTFHAGNWHPLTWLSHMTDVHLFGLDAGRHHLVNVAFHLLNTLLLFALLHRLTASPWRSATVAALFALHPINVETVAWIAERKSLLSTTAWILAIGFYARWTKTRSLRDYALLVACFIAGLLSKPMIVTLPAMLLAVDIWPLDRLQPGQLLSRDGRKSAARLIFEKLPLFALSGAASAATLFAQSSRSAVASRDLLPMTERVLNAFVSFSWYLGKAFVPTDLAVLHPHPATLDQLVSRPAAFLSLALAAGLFALAVRYAKAAPYVLAGLLWYVITLLPVIGIIQVGLQAHADRYAYVPLIGIFFAVTWLAADAARALRVELPAFVAATLLLAFGAWLTRQQLLTWRNSETLFLQALAAHDGNNPVAKHNLMSHHTFLGDALKKEGNYPAALAEFGKALEYAPSAPDALYNYGAALSDVERFAEAVPYYERSLRADSAKPEAWRNLGDAFVMLGRLPEAIGAYERGLSHRGDDKFLLYGLAYAAARTGDMRRAQAALARLQTIDPALAQSVVAQFR